MSDCQDNAIATLGEYHDAADLFPLVYRELRQLAAAQLAREKPGQTLQPTALVHEAYLRLSRHEAGMKFKDAGHFLVMAAEAMRRILIDSARRKATEKRGGDHCRLPFDESIAWHQRPEEAIAVDESLDALAAVDAQAAELVKLHYFGGFSIAEAGALLGMSRASAYRLWSYARAWLFAALSARE